MHTANLVHSVLIHVLDTHFEQNYTNTVIAETLSEEEIGGLKMLFKTIDADNSGMITYEEVKDGLRRVGSELTEHEVQALMDAADIDNGGTIDYGEFIAATVHMNKLEREKNLINAFSFFDKERPFQISPILKLFLCQA